MEVLSDTWLEEIFYKNTQLHYSALCSPAVLVLVSSKGTNKLGNSDPKKWADVGYLARNSLHYEITSWYYDL